MCKWPKSFGTSISASVALLLASGFAPLAQAQEGADESIEEIITTGTRRSERTASDSSVAIDVISGQEFENMGTPDMDDMLRNTLPSYNVKRHAIDDAATLVRPATMRGLPPDNVLILVNGKRRHRSGVIAELGGSLAAGAQGVDLASLPPMAIKQVEVLRDGASAQYGSDAIAGVINFVLNDASSGYSVEARTGEFFEGDGTLTQIAANGGFALGDDGFANITFQWREQDPTSRSTQRTDAATLLTSGNAAQQASVRQPYAQIWGAPELKDDWTLFLNAGIELSGNSEVYFFGNVAERETEGGFFFRNPNDRTGVFDNGSETDRVSELGTRAVVDTRIGGSISDPLSVPLGTTGYISNCPALASPGSGGDGVPLDAQTVLDDEADMAALPANCFVLNQLLPGGYTPQFGGQLEDAAAVIGIRGEMANGLFYDFSGGIGRNNVEFFLNNTWNPSLGPDGIVNGALQRDFRIGANQQFETNVNADFVLPISVDAFASDLSFAFGAEWRNEQFQTRIGEEASWSPGRFAFQSGPDGLDPNCYDDPDVAGFQCALDVDGDPIALTNLSIGAHGFAGFSPQQAGTWDRSNIAAYVDLEADVTDNFTAGVAVRFEDFEDFGTTTNGKFSARWSMTDSLALRGSVSTGFRAPTPGQSNVTKVSTVTIDGELQQRGQIPPTNPIAQVLGAEPLVPEDATSFSLGVVWDVSDNISLTLDAYQIELKDRIAQTGSIVISDIDAATDPRFADVDCPNTKLAGGNASQCLQELGVPGAADLNSVSFYTNDFETTTTGIDLVATWALEWGNAGNGDLTVAWNWTETEVDSAGQEVDRNRVVDLENFNPKNRGIFTYQHFIGGFRFLARASFYDDWIQGDFSDDNPANPVNYTIDCTIGADQCYPSQWLLDLEAGYTINDTWSIMVGAQNIGDEFGPIDDNNLDGTIGSGNTYDTSTPYGQDGGFWYLRLRADFN